MDKKSFEREARYIVIKLTDLNKLRGDQTETLRQELAKVSRRLPKRECVVVEHDWPEYNLVWMMLEHRMAGKPVPDFNAVREVEALRELSVTNIMLDVTPGASGMGEEVYAKSVADVERVLGEQGDRIEELEGQLASTNAGKEAYAQNAIDLQLRNTKLAELLRSLRAKLCFSAADVLAADWLLSGPVERQKPVAWMALNRDGYPEKCLPSDPEGFPVYRGSAAPLVSAPKTCTSCNGTGDLIDAIGDWRGYCSCPDGEALKNKPAPVAPNQGDADE